MNKFKDFWYWNKDLIIIGTVLVGLIVGAVFLDVAIDNKMDGLIQNKKIELLEDGIMTDAEQADFIQYSDRVVNNEIFFIKECFRK